MEFTYSHIYTSLSQDRREEKLRHKRDKLH